MPSLNEFINKPIKAENYHEAYRNSIFSLPASPEYTMSETCLASLIRNIGSGIKEKDVYSVHSQEGSIVRNLLELKWREFSRREDFNGNVFNYLKSPLAGQTKKSPSKYLNLYPLIPQFSYISNSARFSGSPWNPSVFIKGMIVSGTSSEREADSIWKLIFDSISVMDIDDIWAQILNNLFSINDSDEKSMMWELKELNYSEFSMFSLMPEIFEKYDFPAKTFCGKVHAICALKYATTRKQWLTMFESFLRISMATHLIWLCETNKRLWELIWSVDNKGVGYNNLSVADYLFKEFKSFELDTKCDPVFRKICGEYAVARIGINFAINYFCENDSVSPKGFFSDFSILSEWCNYVKENLSNSLIRNTFKKQLLSILGKNPTLQQGNSSFAKNMFEYLRHSLGQKATIDPRNKSFDQCYWVVKRGVSKNEPWVFKLGPVSVLMLVAVSVKSRTGNASDISAFLRMYGIELNPDKILSTSLGKSLVDLGLTNDNPDGERGIVVNNPFFQE